MNITITNYEYDTEYPNRRTKVDFWEQGDIKDDYGHYVNTGYYFNDPIYYPDLDFSKKEESDESRNAISIQK